MPLWTCGRCHRLLLCPFFWPGLGYVCAPCLAALKEGCDGP